MRIRGGPATVSGECGAPDACSDAGTGDQTQPRASRPGRLGDARRSVSQETDARHEPEGTRYPREGLLVTSLLVTSLHLSPRTSAGTLLSAAAWTLLLAGALFVVSFEQGALTGGTPLFHELFHDARHLLGVPCH